MTGDAVVVAEGVLVNFSFMRAGAFSVSETGALVYQGVRKHGNGAPECGRIVRGTRRPSSTSDCRLETWSCP